MHLFLLPKRKQNHFMQMLDEWWCSFVRRSSNEREEMTEGNVRFRLLWPDRWVALNAGSVHSLRLLFFSCNKLFFIYFENKKNGSSLNAKSMFYSSQYSRFNKVCKCFGKNGVLSMRNWSLNGHKNWRTRQWLMSSSTRKVRFTFQTLMQSKLFWCLFDNSSGTFQV